MDHRNFYGRIKGKALNAAQKRYLTEDLPKLSVGGISREDNPERSLLDMRQVASGKPLQWPRTPARTDLRAKNKRAHTVGFVPVLRLYDRDFAKFRMPAEFFLP